MEISAKILTHKTDAMSQIQHLVSHGYQHWTAGALEPSKLKLKAFVCKMIDRYKVNASEIQRYRAKKKGQANSQLVLLEDKETKKVFFWLLATDGEGLIHELESLHLVNDKKHRIIMPAEDYELVQTPRSEMAASWTWRMTKEAQEMALERFKSAIRHQNDLELRQALDSLKRTPGFREARKQAFAIEKSAQAEWKRSRKGEWPFDGFFVGFRGRRLPKEAKPVGD